MYLRGYQPGDLESMFILDRLCFPPPFRFTRGAMRRFAEARNALLQLACVRPNEVAKESAPEQLLGFTIVHLEESQQGLAGYVVTLDVAPASRRQGIAAVLMRSVETMAREAGAGEMALHVFVSNTAAIRLYQRLGYVYAGTAKHFYGRGLHALIYRKPMKGDAVWLDPDPADPDRAADSEGDSGEIVSPLRSAS